MRDTNPSLERRSFLSRLGLGSALGAAFGFREASAQTRPAGNQGGTAFQPARHPQDDWLDALPGKHRYFFDTLTPDGFGHGVFFANNYFTASKNAYGLEASDLALAICMRHQSTGFAFTDAMWVKYGAALSERAGNFLDPKTKAVPTLNVYRVEGGYGLQNMNVTIDALVKSGVHFAVCQLATRAIAGVAARRTGGKTDEIYTELTSNLIPNAHMVPAGIIAVNRAQEHGYSLAYIG
jgi:intracellular sulfur oxidation DsrE/DsrF family protein